MSDGTDGVIVMIRPLLPSVQELGAALNDVLTSGWLTNDGPRARRLEVELSAALGIAQLAVCASGTTAIQLACGALDLTGDVIVPAAAFPAVPLAVRRAGCRPVAVDIEPTFLTIDPAAVRAAITPRTRGILAVHTFGCPADVDALRAIADDAGIPLIFDGATCWGISYRGRPLLASGDVSTLSLHATKMVHSVEGGAVLSTVHPIADKVRRLRNFGVGAGGALSAGTNARMSELHAAVGLVVLRATEVEVARRSGVRRLYLDALSDLEWLRPCEFRPRAGPNVAAMPVRLEPGAPVDADTLCAELLKRDIHARAYFAGRYRPGWLTRADSTPVSDAAAKVIVCLPFWGGLSEREVGRIEAALSEIGRRRRVPAAAIGKRHASPV